jgi:hypothetical protein
VIGNQEKDNLNLRRICVKDGQRKTENLTRPGLLFIFSDPHIVFLGQVTLFGIFQNILFFFFL